MKLRYYDGLDGIRGIAVLAVLIFHFFQLQPVGGTFLLDTFQKLTKFGQTGVTLFFVLSGFLITRILLQTRKTEGYFRNFYARRTLRIFPLYYAYLILELVVLPLLGLMPAVAWSEQWFYWVYLQNVPPTFDVLRAGPGHFWSLAVEEHFYLLWPLIVQYASPRRLVAVTLGCILLAVVARVVFIHQGFEVFYFTLTRMDSLAFGALLALVEYFRGFRKTDVVMFAVVGLLLGVVIVPMWVLAGGSGAAWLQVFKFTLLSLAYFCVVGLAVVIPEQGWPVRRCYDNALMRYTGRISYGIYVYHPLCLIFTEGWTKGQAMWVHLMAGVLLSYALASASFYLMEKPLLGYKRFFDYRKPASTPSDT